MKKTLLIALTFILNIIAYSQCNENNIGCTDEIACNYDPNAVCLGENSCSYECYGCLDPEACNYNPEATLSYNYCVYTDLGCGCGFPAAEPGYDCFGECLVDLDGDGICDEIYGCTDPLAPNFIAEANIEDGSCENTIYGCINPFAENYDENANTNDGSCELIGCMAEGALNYSESATIDSGECVWLEPVIQTTCNNRYLEKIYTEVEVETITYSDEYSGLKADIYQGVGDTDVEDRPLIIWIHGGGWMDVPETNGSAGDRTNAQSQFVCTEFAQRGYVAVSIDYRLASFFQILCLGLCEYFGDISPWTPWDIADYIFDHGAKSYSDSKAAIRFFRKTFAEGNPYRINPDHIYVGGHSAGAQTTNHLILEQENDITSSHYMNNHINNNGGYYGNSGNYGFSSEVAGGFALSGAIPTLNSINEQDFDKLYISVHGEADPIVGYGADPWAAASIPFASLIMPTFYGAGSISEHMDNIGMENYHLSFQGDPWNTAGHEFEAWGPNGKYAMIDFVVSKIYNNLPCSSGDIGCTDSSACNYDPDVINDNGSCSEIYGCTDSSACNYDEYAGCDDDSCYGLVGCMETDAFNYNSLATCQGFSSCIDIIEGCTNLYANNFNELANTDDGSCQVEGCTDESAANYSYLNTIENGSCYYTAECIETTIEYISECENYEWFEVELENNGIYSPSMLNPISDNYEGTTVDMSNPTSLLIGNPNANGNDGLIRMYERDDENWIQKGNTINGNNRFGHAVAMGDVNTIAASSPNSDFNYTVCGTPYWEIVCGFQQVGFWPFVVQIPMCLPEYNDNCNQESENNKGLTHVYNWVNNQWIQKGEPIWGTFAEDFSGDELDMPDSNTIAIGSSQTGEVSGGSVGNIKVFEYLNNDWIQKGNSIYGQSGGDEVGKGFSMSDANNIAVCYSNQELAKIFEWNGTSWTQKGPSILVENIGQSISMYDNSTVGIVGDSYTEVYEWNGVYWAPKGTPILFSNGQTVSMGGPNTISITNNESVALFRYENDEWLLKTQTYNSPGGVVMGNPNILSVPGTVYEYIPEINESGCEEFSMISLTIDDPAISGCTNPYYCNYDSEAICDDGSCSNTIDCTDPIACNYNPLAACDDGSCFYSSECPGCTDETACNFNPNAVLDNETCYNNDLGCGCDEPAAISGYDCDGNCLEDGDNDGVCDEFEINGCQIEIADNYNPSATDDDGSCIISGCMNNEACNFNPLANIDDGSCIGLIGCTDDTACNFNPDATCDNESCLYPGCTDPLATNYNELAGCDDGSCPEGGVYNIAYINEITTCNGYIVDQGGSDNWWFNEDDHIITIYPENEGEYVTIDLINDIWLNWAADLVIHDGENTDAPIIAANYFDGDGNLQSNGPYNASLQNTTGALTLAMTVYDCCGEGFVAEIGCTIEPSCMDVYGGCMDSSACNFDPNASCDDESCVYPGCMDPLATNYNPLAACDDGSCPEGGVYNIASVNEITTCSGYVVDQGGSNNVWFNDEDHTITIYPENEGEYVTIDLIEDIWLSGIWQWAADLVIHDGENTDAPIIAANYFDGDGNMQANGPYNASNSSGALTISMTAYYDCEDTCNDDCCGSGFIAEIGCTTELECGCMDPLASNYNPTATCDDGSCPEGGVYNIANVNEITTCSGYVVDQGGSDNYWLNEDDHIITIYPENEGEYVTIDLIDDIWVSWAGDLLIYDGENTDSPIIAANYFDGDVNMQTNGPYISTDSSGALTIEMIVYDCCGEGFVAEIGCTTESEYGCMDPLASNYNPLAIYDDGSCPLGGVYNIANLNEVNSCSGYVVDQGGSNNAWLNEDDHVITIYPENEGEYVTIDVIGDIWLSWAADLVIYDGENTNATIIAANYFGGDGNLQENGPYIATNNTGALTIAMSVYACCGTGFTAEIGCILTEIYGCIDPEACNYNPDSNTDNNSCIYPENYYLDCSGNCLADGDFDGVCDELEIQGCTDMNACNYDNSATDDDDSCYNNDLGCGCDEPAAEFSYDCDGICLSDIDGDGVCDENEILGCSNYDASNYNPNATDDDGSCDYGPWGEILESECLMTIVFPSDMTIFYGNEIISSAWIGAADSDGNVYGSVFWSDGNLSSIEIYGSSENDNGMLPGEEISWIIYPPNYQESESFYPFVNYSFGNNQFVCYGLAGISDMTLNIDGCTDSNAYNFDSNSNTNDGSCCYIAGCTESSAFNYNPTACFDDNSCVPLIYGCIDYDALNFNIDANTDDGSCDFGPWGEVPSTDCNMTVLLQGGVTTITVEGEVATNIWIGVTNSVGDVVGSVLWTDETTSIAVWGAEGDTPGMEAGEEMNWIVSTDNGDIIGSATFSFGSGEWACNGLAGVSTINFVSTFYQEIDLSTGWGIWSTYIDPEDPNMASVFADVVTNLTIVKDENGSVYWPMFGLNSIGELTDGKGYQAKMTADDVLVLEGNLVPFDLELELTGGWGIMGYLHQDCYNAADMMAPVVSDLTIVKDENGSVYWPMFGLNSIGDMCPGKGYQVKMTTTSMFSYPSGGRFAFSDVTTVGKTVHYETASNTGNNMTIGLPTTAWDVMPAIGDEIAAYDESGRLIGNTLFTGDNIALTVWGDDLTTDAKDGLAIGEQVTFKLWNSDMNTESTLVVTKWDAGSDAYTMDGISIASNIIVSGSTLADTYKLYQNVPNPFNGTTTVKFYVPESTEVTIGVYNMLGEYIVEVTNDIYNIGKHEVIFDANDLSQGTYFVKMTTDKFTATKNMNIVK